MLVCLGLVRWSTSPHRYQQFAYVGRTSSPFGWCEPRRSLRAPRN